MVCNQSEENIPYGDAIHAMRDYIRLTAITYQSFGLDKNKALVETSALFFETNTQNGTGLKTLDFLNKYITIFTIMHVFNFSYFRPFNFI